jgi:protein-arginine kinase activator protein McsA
MRWKRRVTIDTPLTCYMCGVTSDEFVTVDLLGCLRVQEAATKRFVEKFVGSQRVTSLFVMIVEKRIEPM